MKNFAYVLLIAAVLLPLASAPAGAAQINSQSTLIDGMFTPAPPAAPETRFAGAIPDLPLMPGLEPRPEEDVSFATKGGRIAESMAEGDVDIDNVYKFYRRTLPHLGWTAVDGRTYERAHEQLRIDARADGKLSTVHFTVKPAD